MKTFTTILSFMATLLVSCSGEHPKPNATSKLRESIKHTDHIYVHEGLPHQAFESELLKTERERKDTITIADYPFYSPKVEITGKSSVALKALISNSKNFRQFVAEKRCGGFHPDFAVSWSDGNRNYSVLFCYGCGEVKIFDGDRVYRYDGGTSDELKNLLKPFQVKRPKQQNG